jgi:hypothetical protein
LVKAVASSLFKSGKSPDRRSLIESRIGKEWLREIDIHESWNARSAAMPASRKFPKAADPRKHMIRCSCGTVFRFEQKTVYAPGGEPRR